MVFDTEEDKILKSARTFLNRWNGKQARLWSLTTSIKSLRIVISDDLSLQTNLYIACIDPQRIEAPVFWENCQLEISKDSSSLKDPIYCVRDVFAQVKILCGKIEIKENVKLFK